MHAARAVGVDLVARPDLSFLAELVLCLPLPSGWEVGYLLCLPTTTLPTLAALFRIRYLPSTTQVILTGGSAAPLYRNTISNLSSSSHPLVAYAETFV